MIIEKTELVNYKLKVETGIHIGGNSDNYGIGGVDTPVIKNPFDNKPIIPGSSIKGKIRMLLETLPNEKLKEIGFEKLEIIKVFGPKTNKEKIDDSLTRVIFRDLNLSDDSTKLLERNLGSGIYTEVKAENTIDRFKVEAKPRFIERVPAGVEFEGEFILLKLKGDDKDYSELIEYGFKLLENNYLGGSGSRGYGKVSYQRYE